MVNKHTHFDSSTKLINYTEAVNALDKDKLSKTGKKIYKENPTFAAVANAMEHPLFREIYNEHFQDWDNVKVLLMFMKTYELIEKNDETLNPYQKIAILKHIATQSDLRKYMVKCMSSWVDLSKGIEDYKKNELKVIPLTITDI